MQKQFDMVNKDWAEERTVLPGQGLSTEPNREIFRARCSITADALVPSV